VREPTGADAELLARLRAGDTRAFETLVTADQQRVFGVALRMLGSRAEAEDVAQERRSCASSPGWVTCVRLQPRLTE
jgi:sigma-70-like protein